MAVDDSARPASAWALLACCIFQAISAIGGGPPFHPRCVHVLTPFVERLATEEEQKAGMVSPEVLNRSPAELQSRFRSNHRKSVSTS